MTTLSSFRINQPPGTGYANYDRARRDLDLYSVGNEAVECEAYEKAQTSYSWEFVSQPDGASVSITNSDQHTCNFQLTVRGGYLIRLTVNEGYPSEHSTTLYLGVAMEGSGLSLPALSETNQDNSQSPYSGVRGSEEKLNALLKYVEARTSAAARPETLSISTALAEGEDSENRLYLVGTDAITLTLPDVTKAGTRYFIQTPGGGRGGNACVLEVYDGTLGDELFVGPFNEVYDSANWQVIDVLPGALLEVVSAGDSTNGFYWMFGVAQGIIADNGSGDEWHFSSKDPALIAQYSDTIYREQIGRYTTNTGFSDKAGWLLTNEGASGDIEFTLPSVSSSSEVDDSTYRFQQRGDNLITIKTNGSDKIRLPNGRQMAGYLKSTSELCYIELNLDDTNDEWKVIQGAGLWEGATAGDGYYDFGGPLAYIPAAITTSRSVDTWEAGSIFSSGSGGDDPTIFTLPASERGVDYTFVSAGTDKTQVARGSTDVIYAPDGTSFTALETTEQNSVLKILALGTGGWFIVGGSGTWYDPATPTNKVYLNGSGSNFSGAGNPNGVVAGVVSQLYWDTTNKMLYINHDGSTGWYVV